LHHLLHRFFGRYHLCVSIKRGREESDIRQSTSDTRQWLLSLQVEHSAFFFRNGEGAG
jgi:hypothetical protein